MFNRELISDPTWTYTTFEKLVTFDADLTGTAGNVAQKRFIANWEQKIQDYGMFWGIIVRLREQIMKAVDEQYLPALKDTLLDMHE